MTNRADAELRPGDLILVELGPVRGTEQDGRRPALVVSAASMNTATRRVIACPITGNTEPWPTKVLLPSGAPVKGAILTDQIWALDQHGRILRRLGCVPDEVLAEVRHQLSMLLAL